jgi:hypothetical protein
VAVGDFNGDGIADLAVTNFGPVSGPPAPGTVSILLGNGDGTFRAAVDYAAGLGPLGVALGDFNGDGVPDLVVTNAEQVSVLLGNGDGTFRAAVSYDVGISPGGVAVADFNRDGISDLVVCNLGDYPTGQRSNVSVLLGRGDGSFRAAVNYATENGANAVAVGDFNGDGIPDLAVANFGDQSNNGQGGGVSILFGRGDGTFEAAINYTAGTVPGAITAADVNGDGILDLAVTNLISNDVSILLGKGDGTFQAAVNYAVGRFPAGPTGPVVRDFNGDGIPDLGVVFAGGVRVLLGNGDGTFQITPISYLGGGATISSFPPNIAVGDFNGDGLPDLAVTNGDARNVSILIDDGKWAP